MTRLPWWAYLLGALCIALMLRGIAAIAHDGLWIWQW